MNISEFFCSRNTFHEASCVARLRCRYPQAERLTKDTILPDESDDDWKVSILLGSECGIREGGGIPEESLVRHAYLMPRVDSSKSCLERTKSVFGKLQGRG